MLDPTYFQTPTTYVSVKHPRLGESNQEQRPSMIPVLVVDDKGQLTLQDNGGTNCKAA